MNELLEKESKDKDMENEEMKSGKDIIARLLRVIKALQNQLFCGEIRLTFHQGKMSRKIKIVRIQKM